MEACEVTTIRALISAIKGVHSRWRHWTGSSIGRKIFGAAITVGFLAAGVRVVALGNTQLTAALFGTGDVLEAFFIAQLLTSFIMSVVAGSFESAFIPTYVRVRTQQGEEEARKLFSQVMVLVIGLLGIAAALLALSSTYLLPFFCSGFAAEKLALTQRLFYFLLPLIVVNGVIRIYASVLNANEHFAYAALVPVIIPVSSITALLLWHAQIGIYALATGAAAGFLGELFLLSWALKRQRHALIPRWHDNSLAIRQVIRQYLPMVAGALLMGGTRLVDGAMAAMLDSGSVASLSYGNRIVGVILVIATTALGTAVFPSFSKLVSVGDWLEIRWLLKSYSGLILSVTVPLALLLAFTSEPLVRLLFERGEFSETNTQLVGRIQAVYGLQMPFFVCGILFVRLISSMMSNHILFFASFMNLLLNIMLNYLFMQYFGVVGIALSTVCVYFVSCVFLVSMVYRILWRITH